MEDPWGSPWATDSATPKLDLPTPPPSAHFTTEPPGTTQTTQQQQQRLPWEDGDPWGGSGGGWADVGPGRISPAWTRSPGLEPVAGRSSASSRQVSPGPWKLAHSDGASEAEARHERLRIDSESKNVSRRASESEMRENLAVGPEAPSPSQAEEQGDESAPADRSTSPQVNGSPADWEDADLKTPTQARAPVSALKDGNDSSRTPVIQTVPPPDADTDTGTETNARPEPARQPSKVQELVEMYDGIAKRSVSPAASTSSDKTPRMKKMEGLTDAATRELLGIEGHDDSDEKPDYETVTTKVLDGEPDVTGVAKAQEDKDADAGAEDDADAAPSPQRRPSLSIDVDLGRLDELFPSIHLPHIEPEPVPDVIIDDTFGSISERKAWYRISRYGSTRKHNYGDEENYKSITWNKSEVRSQAIRIVRRWMEEDSIAGRVVLGRRAGGAVGGASMFNWNSKAPAVGIGELLAKRRGPPPPAASHSRQASRTTTTSAGARSSVSSPTATNGFAFGWASEPLAPPPGPGPGPLPTAAEVSSRAPISPISPPEMASRGSVERQLDIKEEDDAESRGVAKAATNGWNSLPSPPIAETRDVKNYEITRREDQVVEDDDDDDDEDDDDDWGEMVTSSNDVQDGFGSQGPDQYADQRAEHPKTETQANDTSLGLLDGPPRSPYVPPQPPQKAKTTAASALFSHGKNSSGFDAIGDSWSDSGGSGASTPTGRALPIPERLEHAEEETAHKETLYSDPFDARSGSSAAETLSEAGSESEVDDKAVAEILKSLPDLTYMLQ